MFNIGDTVTVYYAGHIPHEDVVRAVTPYGMIQVGNDWYRSDGWLSNDGAGWIEEIGKDEGQEGHNVENR